MKKRIGNIIIYTLFLIQALICIPIGTMFALLPILECCTEYILWQLVGIILISEPFMFYVVLKGIIRALSKERAPDKTDAFLNLWITAKNFSIPPYVYI